MKKNEAMKAKVCRPHSLPSRIACQTATELMQSQPVRSLLGDFAEVWKYPSRHWSSSLRPSISLATDWSSERQAHHSDCNRNGE